MEWQGLALLELAAGHTVAEVKERFSLTPPVVEAQATEDERLLKGLQHPAAQISFAWIESNDELRRVVEGGDFGAWRVFLHPEQRKYASRSYNGPFRLSGGAGTGKTVVLLHRARELARANTQARVLVTTFTTNLADQMRTDLARLDPDLPLVEHLGEVGVRVSGIDALASAVLKRAGAQDVAADAETVLGVATSQVTGRTSGTAWQVGDRRRRWAPPSTGPSGPWCGTSSRATGRGPASTGPSTSPKQRPSPPSIAGGSGRPRGSTWPTTCWSTRAKTSAPRTGSCCGPWSPNTPTTCSSPRTPTSASMASAWCCPPTESGSWAGRSASP
ncbi:MAG: UvrD-helicase domain-containing protein [Propionibacteriaceae bacterium]|nr:UvrD-helicase domain-containing protein [Propionibacteriaceae bacterium]